MYNHEEIQKQMWDALCSAPVLEAIFNEAKNEPLTYQMLEEVHKALMESELPPRYCDVCGQVVFTNQQGNLPLVCWDCQTAIDYEGD